MTKVAILKNLKEGIKLYERDLATGDFYRKGEYRTREELKVYIETRANASKSIIKYLSSLKSFNRDNIEVWAQALYDAVDEKYKKTLGFSPETLIHPPDVSGVLHSLVDLIDMLYK
jgi:hypothetical protein